MTPLKPGDIILTHAPNAWLGRAILIGQSLGTGAPALWGHAMRYIGDGQVISQDWHVDQLPLTNWKGQTIRAWSSPAYDEGQRKLLVDNARWTLGRGYDWLGLLGQAFRAVPVVGKWLSDEIQIPWLSYCSEGICQQERGVNPVFMGGGPCQVSPQDIDTWCSQQGWNHHDLSIT